MADTLNPADLPETTGLFGRFISLDQFEILIFFTLFILIILCTKTIRVLKEDASYHNAPDKKTGDDV